MQAGTVTNNVKIGNGPKMEKAASYIGIESQIRIHPFSLFSNSPISAIVRVAILSSHLKAERDLEGSPAWPSALSTALAYSFNP